ncbi:MAG: hypothetical protein WAR77_08905 [Saprospiraceae bacterium]|nr:hypothetical protein [Saprospiraceae bacterium]MBK8483002.1 hypothetical protein [Saprospiraceae bacterium]MBK8483022.1 hypothetical protein [Saprospiraceae bacterium]MBK9726490.1 hypothetical protein [Saprospiraceae bacterium]MBK9726525.1 hypothetical protein [Saprospiraceae bacterium]
MKTKEAFHKLIDTIEDEGLLNEYYNLITRLSNSQEGELWNTLTNEQKEELMLSYEESKDPKNLISHEEVIGQFSKWLEK